MNQEKMFLKYSLFLSLMYVVWLLPGYWNLGFSLINLVFLLIVVFKFKNIWNDKYLKIVWLLSLSLGMFMTIRSYFFVRFLSLLSIFILNLGLVVLGQNAKAKLGFERIIRTGLGLIGTVFGSYYQLLSTLGRFNDSVAETRYKKILVGVVMSIPLLLIFGALFYMADPIFAKLVDLIRLPKIVLDEMTILKTVGTIMFFGVVSGILNSKLAEQIKKTNWLKSVTELNVAVVILEVLFFVFAFVQIKYFLATPADLKKLEIVFSEYTRSGYGQMLFASILAYLVVLRLEFAQRSIPNKLTKFLIWSMLSYILIFIVAATKRNYVYQSIYGFTDVRLLGFFLSAWLIAMLFLLAFKLWKKRGVDFFTRGIILITAISVLAMNIFNIDGMVVRIKPARFDWGIDYEYLSSLSFDAWQGWEGVLADTEEKINNKKINNFGDYLTLNQTVLRLKEKSEVLNKMNDNNWNNGGSFNYSAMKAWAYLEKNQNRINDILKKIDDRRMEIEKNNGQ